MNTASSVPCFAILVLPGVRALACDACCLSGCTPVSPTFVAEETHFIAGLCDQLADTVVRPENGLSPEIRLPVRLERLVPEQLPARFAAFRKIPALLLALDLCPRRYREALGAMFASCFGGRVPLLAFIAVPWRRVPVPVDRMRTTNPS